MYAVAYVLWGCVVVSTGVLFFMVKNRDTYKEVKALKKPICLEETIIENDEVEKIPYKHVVEEEKDLLCHGKVL